MNLFRSSRFKRGGMATLMSVVFIAIIVVINILVSVLTERFPSLNLDLTAQGLNTLSDQALEIARGVEQETDIYLIGAEESYRRNRLYADYGIEYSQVANLAERLAEANSRIKVRFVDPDENPGFISAHAEDSLTSGCVLVETERRSKALQVTDLFNVTMNSSYRTEVYSKVDGALAGALEVVNLDSVPVLTIATGHDEMLTTDVLSTFTSKMEDQNFEIQTINFLTDEIPQETQILMLPTPAKDYTEDEIAKLRAFLADDSDERERSLLVTCHAVQGELPRLASFLEEWGVRVESGSVAETDTGRMVMGDPRFVLVENASSEILAANTYNNLVAPASSPLTLLFAGNGDVNTSALLKTASTAYVLEDVNDLQEDPETAEQTVAAIAASYIQFDKKYVRRSVVVFGSSYMFTGTYMSASAFSDGQYITDILQYCTGTDASSVVASPKQVQTNVLDISASSATLNLLGLGLFTIAIPLAILIAGLAVFLRRRHL